MYKYFKELEKYYSCKLVWKTVDLQRYVDRKKFYDIPETEAVYVVRTKDDILYIGCSTNLKKRLITHALLSLLSKQASSKNKLKISFGLLTNQSLISTKKIERSMIDKCCPKYNTRKASKEPNRDNIKQFIEFFEKIV